MERLGVKTSRLLNLYHVLYSHLLRVGCRHLRRRVLPLLNPFRETLDFLLLLLIVLLLLYEVLLLAFHKSSIVSGVALYPVVLNLIGHIRNLVEKHSVV